MHILYHGLRHTRRGGDGLKGETPDTSPAGHITEIETASWRLRIDEGRGSILLEPRREEGEEASPGLGGGLKSLKLHGDSLSFDYAHFLPAIEKCATLHGHTALVEVEVVGQPDEDGVVIDFGILKKNIRDVLSLLDHRLVVCSRYVLSNDGEAVRVAFNGLGGAYEISLPRERVVILDFESTAENLSAYIAERVLEMLPQRVSYVRVRMSEGVGKSAGAEVRRG